MSEKTEKELKEAAEELRQSLAVVREEQKAAQEKLDVAKLANR